MIFYLNLVMLMVILGRVEAKKTSKPTINYITNNYNNISCTGTTCNFGNVTNQNINNNDTNYNVTNINNNITNNNVTNIFKNETDDQPCYNPRNTTGNNFLVRNFSMVAFSAYYGGGHFTAGSQHTKIPFHFVILNHGDAFDKTTGTFKAPVKGGYSFSYSIRAQRGHDNWARAWIVVEKPDGTKTYYAGTRADNWVISSNTLNVELDKGATVSVYLHAGYKIDSWPDSNTFSGHLLYLA